MTQREIATKGLSATVARASVLSPAHRQNPMSQAQLLHRLLDVRQVMHCIPLGSCVLLSILM